MKKIFSKLLPKGGNSINTGEPPKRVVPLAMAPRDLKGADTLSKKSKRRWRFVQLGALAALAMIIAGIYLPVTRTVDVGKADLAESYLFSYLTGADTSLPVAEAMSEEWKLILQGEQAKPELNINLQDIDALTNGTGYVFVVEDGLNIFQATVVLITESDGDTALGSMPYIEPYLFDDSTVPEIITPGVSTNVADADELARRINRWAIAYFSNDRNQLYELTATDLNIVFYGVNNFTYKENSVVVTRIVEHPEGVVARARVEVTESSNPARSFYIDYDLLIANPNTRTPDIVAWGPAGSGDELSPFENGRTAGLTLLPNNTDSNSTSSTTSPEPEPENEPEPTTTVTTPPTEETVPSTPDQEGGL